MKLENINKAKVLIEELDSIKEFSKNLNEKVRESTIDINGIEFRSNFRAEVSKEFIKEINDTLMAMCVDYMARIEKQLKKL